MVAPSFPSRTAATSAAVLSIGLAAVALAEEDAISSVAQKRAWMATLLDLSWLGGIVISANSSLLQHLNAVGTAANFG